MEKFIKVYDDIVPIEFSNFIEKMITKNDNFPFIYRPNIASAHDNQLSYGFAHLFADSQINHSSMYKDNFSHILYLLCNHLKIGVVNLLLGRVFLQIPYDNAPSPLIHVDMDKKHWVCLYYVNDSDGDTVFYKDDGVTEIQRVAPKKGRIAFFDGNIKHRSSVPKNNPRFIINIDFQGIGLNEI